MQARFLESYARASEADLLRFEAQIGFVLTSDYRQFLTDTNGGCPEPEFFFSQSGRLHEIAFWYGLDYQAGEGPQNLVLRWMVAQLLFRAPAHLICIGRSSDGNLLLLSLAGSDRGVVYFWLHDAMPNQIWDKGPPEELLSERLERLGIEKLADSLTELLNSACTEVQRQAYFETQMAAFEAGLADKSGQSC